VDGWEMANVERLDGDHGGELFGRWRPRVQPHSRLCHVTYTSLTCLALHGSSLNNLRPLAPSHAHAYVAHGQLDKIVKTVKTL